MSKAKKRVIWGIIWLVVWPVWFWIAILSAIGGSDSDFNYHMTAAIIPGIVAIGFFIAARKAKLAPQVLPPLPNATLEHTGRWVKSIFFAIGAFGLVFTFASLGFAGPKGFEYTDVLPVLVSVAFIAYSFRK